MTETLMKIAEALFAPIYEAKASSSMLDIVAGIASVFKKRFNTGFEVRKNLKTNLDTAVGDKKRQSIAKRIALKDIELKVLRNFYDLCQQTGKELRTQIPPEEAIDPSSIGDIDDLDVSTDPNQDS